MKLATEKKNYIMYFVKTKYKTNIKLSLLIAICTWEFYTST